MSGEKTEKPTPKKMRDSAEKGQSYKSRDMIAALIIAVGVMFAATRSLYEVMEMYRSFIAHGFTASPHEAFREMVMAFVRTVLPILLACIAATILMSWLQSGMALAPKAIKIDFAALNPVSGFKKLFSMKTVKELVKALLYLLVFCVAIYLFWHGYKNTLLAQIYVPATSATSTWVKAGVTLIFVCLAVSLLIIMFDGWIDYLLYIKNLKMDKNEVKQENKQAEVSSEVKSRRREVHEELLSDQVKNDISQSQFVLANPTHIAIGIYMDPSMPLPFISVLATEARALATIAYAEKIGVPVVRDIKLTRAIFKTASRYSFVSFDLVDPVFRVLLWLLEVERERNEQASTEGAPSE